jgi:hypothetical protein
VACCCACSGTQLLLLLLLLNCRGSEQPDLSRPVERQGHHLTTSSKQWPTDPLSETKANCDRWPRGGSRGPSAWSLLLGETRVWRVFGVTRWGRNRTRAGEKRLSRCGLRCRMSCCAKFLSERSPVLLFIFILFARAFSTTTTITMLPADVVACSGCLFLAAAYMPDSCSRISHYRFCLTFCTAASAFSWSIAAPHCCPGTEVHPTRLLADACEQCGLQLQIHGSCGAKTTLSACAKPRLLAFNSQSIPVLRMSMLNLS